MTRVDSGIKMCFQHPNIISPQNHYCAAKSQGETSSLSCCIENWPVDVDFTFQTSQIKQCNGVISQDPSVFTVIVHEMRPGNFSFCGAIIALTVYSLASSCCNHMPPLSYSSHIRHKNLSSIVRNR